MPRRQRPSSTGSFTVRSRRASQEFCIVLEPSVCRTRSAMLRDNIRNSIASPSVTLLVGACTALFRISVKYRNISASLFVRRPFLSSAEIACEGQCHATPARSARLLISDSKSFHPSIIAAVGEVAARLKRDGANELDGRTSVTPASSAIVLTWASSDSKDNSASPIFYRPHPIDRPGDSLVQDRYDCDDANRPRERFRHLRRESKPIHRHLDVVHPQLVSNRSAVAEVS